MLVGDAFATSCPAAGTGTNKVLTDVERLCNVHIPQWLASDGMGEEKIASFYDDAVKQACDQHSAAKAYYLRALSTDAGLAWQARRWGKFIGQLGVGTLRHAASGSPLDRATGTTPTAAPRLWRIGARPASEWRQAGSARVEIIPLLTLTHRDC